MLSVFTNLLVYQDRENNSVTNMSTKDLLKFLKFIDSITDMDFDNRPSLPSHLPSNNTTKLTRPRTENFQNYDDVDFFKIYRMSKNTVLFILDQINEELEFDSDRNESVAPVEQLLIALRFYATGTHLQAIAQTHGVSVPTVSRVVKKVSKAIVKLHPRYIKMPSSQEEIDYCQREFFNIAKFPFVVGCIDCTHIKIQSPGGDNAKLFRNKKGYFSVNVQTVSDAKLKVRNVVAHMPGSTDDSAIFNNSQLCRDFEMGVYGNSCLLGDSGYPLKKYLLTPYLNPNTEPKEQYNHSQTTTRNTVDRQHEVLKRRFPALAVSLRINLQTAINVIVACCILHNICIDKGEDIPPNEMDISYTEINIQNGHTDQNYHDQYNGYDARRTVITNNFFS